jgi:ATP-dependent Clp protease ATP-binding subunit ClpB
MSEYMEKHSVSRLIGAPPGYVGYDEGGQLTEIVRRKQYCVLLLDEVEKAHADVFNVLLQLLDDGRLTDNQGRVVNFKNTVVIMTSNVAQADLGRYFKPEFLNRLDEILIFDQLTRADLSQIIDIQIASLGARLQDRGVTLTLTEDAKSQLADEGYDPQYGARPLKRVLQKRLQNPLATMLLRGEIRAGGEVICEPGADGIELRHTP